MFRSRKYLRSDRGDWSYVETKLVAGLTFTPVLSLLCENENPGQVRGVYRRSFSDYACDGFMEVDVYFRVSRPLITRAY